MRPLRIVTAPPDEGSDTDTSVPSVPTKTGPPSRPSPSKSLSQEAAIRHVFDYAGPRQGWRMIAIGSTGSGKTWFQKKVASLSAGRDDYVLIHDAKDKVPQYVGAVRDSVFAYARNPPDNNTVIFRHEDPERVAELGWKAADEGATSLVLIDEMCDALSAPMHFRAKGKSRIDEIYRKGRSRGVSILGSCQAPQWFPTVALTQSDFKIIFRLDARSLDYAAMSLRLTRAETETIRKLRTGEFVMVQQGVDWDGTIYGPH